MIIYGYLIIGKYHKVEDFKILVEKMASNLSEDGNMLICYLYSTTIENRYEELEDNIYNLSKVYSLFEDYITAMETFCGIRGIIFEDENYSRDSVLVYKKSRKR